MSENVSPESVQGTQSSPGTFEISVKFTKNATWQGQIHWIEKNKKQNFRSALEMLKLMDEALTGNNESAPTKW